MSEIHVDTLKTAERVRVATDMGYFPVAQVTKDGAILAVFRAGAAHIGRPGYLVASRSEDAGRTWSAPVTVVNTRRYDDRNPAVGVAKDGTVVVAYHANASYGANGEMIFGKDRRDPVAVHTGLVLSYDDGRSWGEPMITTDQTAWDGQSPYGKFLTLADGRMAMPIYLEKTWLLWSRDDGRSWGEHQLVADDINETAYCVLPSGEWLLFGRSAKNDHSELRWSKDGQAWSEPMPFFTDRRFPSDLAVLGDGSVLAVYGYRADGPGARARRSTDGGRTWSEVELIVHDAAKTWDTGYPSAVRADGWVVMLFYDAGDVGTHVGTGAGCFVECVRVREDELVDAMS